MFERNSLLSRESGQAEMLEIPRRRKPKEERSVGALMKIQTYVTAAGDVHEPLNAGSRGDGVLFREQSIETD
jgi:hypothetical protein